MPRWLRQVACASNWYLNASQWKGSACQCIALLFANAVRPSLIANWWCSLSHCHRALVCTSNVAMADLGADAHTQCKWFALRKASKSTAFICQMNSIVPSSSFFFAYFQVQQHHFKAHMRWCDALYALTVSFNWITKLPVRLFHHEFIIYLF